MYMLKLNLKLKLIFVFRTYELVRKVSCVIENTPMGTSRSISNHGQLAVGEIIRDPKVHNGGAMYEKEHYI